MAIKNTLSVQFLGLRSFCDGVEAHFFVRSEICRDELFDCINLKREMEPQIYTDNG